MSTNAVTKNDRRPVALVTGASGGIGEHLAREAAARGYDVVLVARSEGKLAKLAAEITAAHGAKAHVLAADLSLPGAAVELHARTEALGLAVDALINNAGYGTYGAFAETSLDREVEMIQLNVTALTALTKLYLPGMLARGTGRVMNVASTAAFQPGPLMAVYYATKAYVLSLSEALAAELEGSGVTVTALCPGPTASGFQAGAKMEESKLVRGKSLPTSAEVAAYGFDAMLRGRRVAIHGFVNRTMATGVRFLPRRAVTSMVRRFQERSGSAS